MTAERLSAPKRNLVNKFRRHSSCDFSSLAAGRFSASSRLVFEARGAAFGWRPEIMADLRAAMGKF